MTWYESPFQGWACDRDKTNVAGAQIDAGIWTGEDLLAAELHCAILRIERQLLQRDNAECCATNYSDRSEMRSKGRRRWAALHGGFGRQIRAITPEKCVRFPPAIRKASTLTTDLPAAVARHGLHYVPMANGTSDASESELGVPRVSPQQDLTAQVYKQLRHIAEIRLASQSPGHTLQATALVHEAYLKLQHHPSVFGLERATSFAWRQRRCGRSSSIMRGRRDARNAAVLHIGRAIADVAQLAAEQDPEEILALEEALCRFEQLQPRAAEVVKLRFFAGLTVEEASEVTGLSVRTVNREWKFARAWLFKAPE